MGGTGDTEGWGSLPYLGTFLCCHPWGSLRSGGALGGRTGGLGVPKATTEHTGG